MSRTFVTGHLTSLFALAVFPASVYSALTGSKAVTIFYDGDTPKYYEYKFTIDVAAGKAAFNSYRIKFNRLSQIESTEVDGNTQDPPAGNANLFRALFGAAQTPPATINARFTTIDFPKVVEGKQLVEVGNWTEGPPESFTDLNHALLAALPPPPPGNPIAEIGTTTVMFAEGTFPPNARIDLLQSTDLPDQDQNAFIGEGSSNTFGAITVQLSRPMTGGPLHIGVNGTVLYAISLPDGDANCDGVVNTDDISAFILALIDPTSFESTYALCPLGQAEVNADGFIDGSDIAEFVTLLLAS